MLDRGYRLFGSEQTENLRSEQLYCLKYYGLQPRSKIS